MSPSKIIVPVTLLAAMAAATYLIHSRAPAQQATTAISATAAQPHAVKQTQVSDDDALANSPSWKLWPTVTDF
jgi:uncharacterized protein (UPF0333 family)